MRYFTSDHHFGHRNIIEYARRPFATPDDMGDHFVRRWNETVTDADEVWVLGDFLMGRIRETLSIVAALRGRIVLVPGNHDHCWPGFARDLDPDRRSAKTSTWRDNYLEAGIAEILDDPPAIRVADQEVLLHHFPFAGGGDHSHEERYEEWRRRDDGSWLLCGHVHDLFRQRDRQINVGVDAWGGELVEESQIAALITAGPAELPVLAWPAALGSPTPSGPQRSRTVRRALDVLVSGAPGDKAVRRLRDRCGEEWPAVLEALSEDGHDARAAAVNAQIARLDRPAEPGPSALVSGDDLVALGIPAGPGLGRLLSQIEQDRAAGRITTREEALDLARRSVATDHPAEPG